MFDLTVLFLGAGSAVGLAALLSTDPLVVRKAHVPLAVEYYQGYDGDLVSKLLRERIRVIARQAPTARGDSLGVFNADASALDILAEHLHMDGLIDSLREFLDLHFYSLDPYLVHSPDGIKLGLKGESAEGQLISLSVLGDPDEDVPDLIDRLAQLFIEKVDPYLLTFYYFRQDYARGDFSRSLPMIEHCIRVLPPELMKWPLLVRGRVHYRLGEYDEAILKYQDALRIDPVFPLAYARWGEALVAKGNIKEGMEKMQLAVVKLNDEDFTPKMRSLNGSIIYTLLADHLVKIGADEAARGVYVRGLALASDNPLLLTGLGSLYLRHGQFDPAISLLTSALATHPDPTVPRQLLDQATFGEFGQE